jgi:hypothetical protein
LSRLARPVWVARLLLPAQTLEVRQQYPGRYSTINFGSNLSTGHIASQADKVA